MIKLTPNKGNNPFNHMIALLVLLLLITSGFLLFWVAPMLANKASDFLLFFAIILFFLGLFVAILSIRWLYIYINFYLESKDVDEKQENYDEGE